MTIQLRFTRQNPSTEQTMDKLYERLLGFLTVIAIVLLPIILLYVHPSKRLGEYHGDTASSAPQGGLLSFGGSV